MEPGSQFRGSRETASGVTSRSAKQLGLAEGPPGEVMVRIDLHGPAAICDCLLAAVIDRETRGHAGVDKDRKGVGLVRQTHLFDGFAGF